MFSHTISCTSCIKVMKCLQEGKLNVKGRPLDMLMAELSSLQSGTNADRVKRNGTTTLKQKYLLEANPSLHHTLYIISCLSPDLYAIMSCTVVLTYTHSYVSSHCHLRYLVGLLCLLPFVMFHFVCAMPCTNSYDNTTNIQIIQVATGNLRKTMFHLTLILEIQHHHWTAFMVLTMYL